MPKIVDHHKQKQKLAEAAWRLIRRDGIESVTVRKVAEEAGISPGSMRYYFSSQSELFQFSMKLVSDRVYDRVAAIRFTGNPFEDAQTLLFELLPLDDERRAEMEVWTVFHLKALTDKGMQPLASQVYDETKRAVRMIIDALVENGFIKRSIDRNVESTMLFALIDGLALHRIMQPDKLSPDMMKNIVLQHLHALCK
ncbi:TetR family transcriptional regulator C-terminal domain-containing protein [Ectobacillus antri]|jgi:AcrR family transcriptional regulator|uniref:TetR family transcriptional regulator C-terminal domain-containing protein n=1 Tax=Ectobacillus antri TaxID=2486280 RepID=A0ABT6H1N1_9BACI|nr:TetR family transcriptional regulator C-terminal domain-containing protein [Ectobacillus antri]MDG4655454.1 TetR family transcriptional regulator C-terminal domain-containing protein [Ectobacillus antri]MDG5753212.1 TetR family transcriptional regulator C-terminal domain-containing protein [Ectobacillus antri]